ncbi:MAG: hypothetical protein IJI25_08735 [Eubacterium sp.]|nr:hypothetical protein [Eubacterium sp.]
MLVKAKSNIEVRYIMQEKLRLIESLLSLVQESAETGDMDSSVYVDVICHVNDIVRSLMDTEGREAA